MKSETCTQNSDLPSSAVVKTTGFDGRLAPTRYTATTVTRYIWLGWRLVRSSWVIATSTLVESDSPVSTSTQVTMYRSRVTGRMEKLKGDSHEMRTPCEVMLATVALGGSGTPVREGGRGVYMTAEFV